MHLLAFGVLAIHSYVLEYRTRFDFYLCYKQVELLGAYKDFLIDLPNGIIILDMENQVIFHNQVITNLILKRDLLTSRLPERQTIDKDKLMTTLNEFIFKEGEMTLKKVLSNWKEGLKYNDYKCTYTYNENKYTFLVKMMETVFQKKRCRVIILRDLTRLEKLKKDNENYKKMYIASIAHDIRTPLNAIIGMLDVIEDSAEAEEEKLYISVAKNTSKLLLFFTYDITDYSQLKTGEFKLNNSETSIKETLNEVLQIFIFSFQKKNLKYFFRANSSVPNAVIIDKNRYIQILMNLIANAVKFTSRGSIKVEVTYDEQTDMLITKVQDTGIGIREEQIPRLFKVFDKVESNNSLDPQGAGFGLVLCKKLAQSLGGDINVCSILDLGTIFTFTIRANAGLSGLGLKSSVIAQESEDLDSVLMDENFEVKKAKLERYIISRTVRFKSY